MEEEGKSTICIAHVRHPSQYIKHFQCHTLFPAHFRALWMVVSLVSFWDTTPRYNPAHYQEAPLNIQAQYSLFITFILPVLIILFPSF